MIVPKGYGKYYLYRHIRLDTNEVFYVGFGITRNSKYLKGRYKRSRSKHGRNKFWNNIINKTDYRIDILFECNSREFINKKEIEFIKLYGRRDLDLGTLTNLTNGGEGRTDKFGIPTGKISKFRKQVYLYNIDGSFNQKFDSVRDCSNFIKCKSCRITSSIKRDTTYKNYIFSFIDKGSYIYGRVRNAFPYQKAVIQLDNDDNYLNRFSNKNEAGKELNINPTGIALVCNKRPYRYTAGGYKWIFEKDFLNREKYYSKIIIP